MLFWFAFTFDSEREICYGRLNEKPEFVHQAFSFMLEFRGESVVERNNNKCNLPC
jgi:hypothetical protein